MEKGQPSGFLNILKKNFIVFLIVAVLGALLGGDYFKFFTFLASCVLVLSNVGRALILLIRGQRKKSKHYFLCGIIVGLIGAGVCFMP